MHVDAPDIDERFKKQRFIALGVVTPNSQKLSVVLSIDIAPFLKHYIDLLILATPPFLANQNQET